MPLDETKLTSEIRVVKRTSARLPEEKRMNEDRIDETRKNDVLSGLVE